MSSSEKGPNSPKFWLIPKLLFFCVFLTSLIVSPNLTAADVPVFVPHPQIYEEATLKERAYELARQYNVDPFMLDMIVSRETNWNPNAIGDHGTSFGLVQIHLPAHPDVSQKQALDPIFALTWAVKELAKGNCRIWTTCR